MLPNFLIIGAERCGTTWVHRCLDEHPEVFVPKAKELHFFNYDFDKGREFYESYFADAAGYRMVGEISPGYLYKMEVAEHIAEYVPDAKLIVIFRDPVERAFSAYNFFKERYKGMTFEEALDNYSTLLERGLYYQQVMHYLKYFSHDQFLFLLFDDLTNSNRDFIRRIYRFLEVDENFVPSVFDKVMNAPIFPGMQDVIYKLKLDLIIDLVKKSPADRLIRNLYMWKKNRSNPSIKKSTRERLAAYYSESNRQLGELIGRDLSHWR